MSAKRIALFGSFSPEIGGGSVPLRDHLKNMPDLNVRWYYLAPQAVQRKRSDWLGKPLSDLQFASDLIARTGFLPGSTSAVQRIVERLEGDLFWVVGHYEGVCVAAELIKRGKPVHLTVHDDPICMFKRSRRYRLLTPLMERHFSGVLKAAKSVDVISSNLREAYLRKYHVESFPVYRYVPELPPAVARDSVGNGLRIGHIGSVYHAEPFRMFLRACEGYAALKKCTLRIVRIGSSPELDAVAAESPILFENRGELDEQKAIEVLASCDFVYAMYPDGSRFECFRRTSLPMKLSTYIQAQRPIFAHTTGDSGLAQVVAKFQVGKVCSSQEPEDLRRAVDELLKAEVETKRFEEAREELMGRKQIDQLRGALEA
jgi:hypothetical protein